mmetsp:Transcript_11340/g.27168  ORF Transcript_11340/g.27168 Transcript_11340/m.27168 type:complete len:728 (+) Transcript_11340:54-2237(+)
MTTTVTKRPDGVALLTLKNPPVNSLAATLLNSLCENAQALAKDDSVKAVVVTGDGNFFCGGAAIDEMPTGKGGEQKASVVDVMGTLSSTFDGFPKPLVAAVNGMALGGGLEVALMCAYRIISNKTAVGLPEVTLGLLPGGQGTQRLPRIVGADAALKVMLTGTPVKAAEAVKLGICDGAADAKSIVDEAAKFALSKVGQPNPQLPSRQMPGAKTEVEQACKQWTTQMAKARKGEIAPAAIIQLVMTAWESSQPGGKGFDFGVAEEQRLFKELVLSPESNALRHLFFAERAAQKVPGVTAKPAPVKSVGIIGAGTMGGGIAMNFVNIGTPVVLVDAKQEFLDRGLSVIKANFARRMKPEQVEKAMSMITPSLSYQDFKDVDLVVEAVFEDMELKKKIFRELDGIVKKDAFLCTNTSGLDVDAIANVTSRPERVMGTHFFSPANVMRLLENVRGTKSSGETIMTMMNMGKSIGKVAVLAGNCDGFIGNRMFAPYTAEARMLLEEGVDIQQIDAALQKYGMAMGPLATGDLIGHDVLWRAWKALGGDPAMNTKTYKGPYDLMDGTCQAERFGQKSGAGFYAYDPKTKKNAGVHPEFVKMLAEVRARKNAATRQLSDTEIVERCLFPLINEGFKILEEGFASRPSDIDIVFTNGYGYPKYRGGPMHWAEAVVGLPKLLDRLKHFDGEYAARVKSNPAYFPSDHFTPSKLLEQCVQEGLKLTQLWNKKASKL